MVKGAGAGSVLVTDGSGCGSERPKNIRIRMRVRIPNTRSLIFNVREWGYTWYKVRGAKASGFGRNRNLGTGTGPLGMATPILKLYWKVWNAYCTASMDGVYKKLGVLIQTTISYFCTLFVFRSHPILNPVRSGPLPLARILLYPLFFLCLLYLGPFGLVSSLQQMWQDRPLERIFF